MAVPCVRDTPRLLERDISHLEHWFEIIASNGMVQRRAEKKLIKTAKPGRNGKVRVTFALPRDVPSGAVSVVGDFNGWDPYAHPLRRRTNGTRSASVTVAAGRTLHFRYLAEGGIWFDDEAASHTDAQGGYVKV